MDKISQRRSFLKNMVLAASGAALVSSSELFTSVLQDTAVYPGYNPFIELKTDLRLSQNGDNFIRIKGVVYCKKTFKQLPEAKVEIWHLSPNSNRFRHHGKSFTNTDGSYTFLTDFPGRETGKFAKVYFKVTHNGTISFSELSLSATRAYINHKHYDENLILGNKMFPKRNTKNGLTEVQFNLTV